MTDSTRDEGTTSGRGSLTEPLEALHQLVFPYVVQAFKDRAAKKLTRMEPREISDEEAERLVRMRSFFEGEVPAGTSIDAGNSPEEAMESLRRATSGIAESVFLERVAQLRHQMLEPFEPTPELVERWLEGSTWRLIYDWLGLCVFVKRNVVVPSAPQVYFDDSMQPQHPSSFELPKGKKWSSIVASSFCGVASEDEMTALFARIRREQATEEDFFPKPVREVLMGWEVNPVSLPRLES